MNRNEYLSAVNEWWYQGEVFGEALMDRWLQLERDPIRRWKWATIQQLETETKARLRPFMMSLGLSVVPDDVRDKVDEASKGFAEKSWPELMEMGAQITSLYLDKFRQMGAAAPDTERKIAHSMVIHESAINTFVRRELAGESENSLEDVIRQLQWPIPRPQAGVKRAA